MEIRPFRADDAAALAELSKSCARAESDFVLNPLWEKESELFAEFDRFGIDPERHVLVADAGDGEVLGMVGFLRLPDADSAGLFCPVVGREHRRRGLGGELLRAAAKLGPELGIKLVTAGIGTRNRAGYALLTAHGYRPVRQHFLMRCDERPRVGAPPLDDLSLEIARPDDAAAIHEIYKACEFEERSPGAMRAVLEDGRHRHAVARHAGRTLGFVELETHWPERVWTAFVGVAPDARNLGLGSYALAWTLDREFDGGAKSALLMLSPANRTALRAYEKVGFRRYRLIDVLERRL